MSNVSDLRSYKKKKEAELILTHIDAILKVFNLSITALDYYASFNAAMIANITLREERKKLEDQRQNLINVYLPKGLLNDQK